jgi:hypothetical protein
MVAGCKTTSCTTAQQAVALPALDKLLQQQNMTQSAATTEQDAAVALPALDELLQQQNRTP